MNKKQLIEIQNKFNELTSAIDDNFKTVSNTLKSQQNKIIELYTDIDKIKDKIKNIETQVADNISKESGIGYDGRID